MTMHKALHPRDDVDRLYVSRKERGRWLARIEDCVDASIQRLEDYIGKHEPSSTIISDQSGSGSNCQCIISTVDLALFVWLIGFMVYQHL